MENKLNITENGDMTIKADAVWFNENVAPFTLRTVDKDGSTIMESTLNIKRGSVIVQQYPSKMRLDQAKHLHTSVVEALEKGFPVITIPDNVKWSVLGKFADNVKFDDGHVYL